MRGFLFALALAVMGLPAMGSGFNPLARVVPEQSGALSDRGGVHMSLGLTQAVPWRVRLLDDPWRVALDFREVDWSGLDPAPFTQTAPITAVRTGAIDSGWSRIELSLDSPMIVEAAEMVTDPADGTALVRLQLVSASADVFASQVLPELAEDVMPAPAITAPPRRRQDGDRPLLVVLDPGHGGIDPGAEHEDLREADLMLTFARELKEELLRDGRIEVVLTREDDRFVALATRLLIARRAGADVFLSLHADALAEGRASGATVYTLSSAGAARAADRLTERHGRTDLLAGVDLTAQDDAVANVLMDLARRETDPRSDRLADALVDGIRGQNVGMHKRPRLEAGFSVLKAPDIPSVLLELGFISSEADRERLLAPEWRRRMAQGIRVALLEWAKADAEEAARLRR